METFDYIVVGAGSSGCVVASRLSEQAGTSVLLLEAGPKANSFWIKAPAGMGKLFNEPDFNWRYYTEPVPKLGGRKVYWPSGRVLGGSSAINGMVYMRGHPRDYDHWESLGNPGWGWSDVLPYFNKSESNARGGPHHGADGAWTVTDPVLHHPTSDAFIQAATRNGIARCADLNAPPYEGIAYQQFTIRNGRRQSSYDAFIAPVRSRRNLTVRTGLHVTQVVFKDRVAVGIEVIDGSQRRVIRAGREVILSAGALGSPQLLMHSGIGGQEQLQRFGISTLQHLPGVGRNLQDHFLAPLLFRARLGSSYNQDLHGLRKYWQGLIYVLKRRGYLALGGSPLSAYVRSSPELPRPDLQLALRPMTFNFQPSGKLVVDKFPGMSAAAVLLHPRSSGFVELKSADPLVAPAFQPSYLEDRDDVERTLVGLRMLRQILATEPIASHIVVETLPGPDATSDDQLIQHLQAHGNCGWHQVGTCKMGNDELSVVDARLRVRGVERLRVVDASIMPQITSGNTSAPAGMIGEKGADMIRHDAVAVG